MNPFPTPHFVLSLQSLQTLMALEHRAPQVVTAKVASFITPGDRLVGPSGQPDPTVAARAATQVTGYLHELLAEPTLVEEWATTNLGTTNLSSILGASFQVVFLVESEVARMFTRTGMERVSNLSAYLVMEALRALSTGGSVKDAYRATFEARQNGVKILQGVPEEFLQRISQLILCYLPTRGLVKDGAVTPEGERLLQHLIAAVGYLMSRETQAPEIAKEAMALMKRGESKTEEEVQTDLQSSQGDTV